jgi:amidohydrolase
MRNHIGCCVALVLASGFACAGDKNRKIDPALATRVAAVDKLIDTEAKSLVDLYKDLHKNPELSLQEERSSTKMAAELQKLGFDVTTKIGGYGLVGIFKNGNGPTILVRTDMDGLPVVEATGLPYSSTVRARDRFGVDVGVMHACGHDMHMACWVGTARTLVAMKDKWAGTLMFIAQPAEEIGMGAKMMLEAGLFKKFAKPDYCLALHCDYRIEAGHVNFTEGVAMANVDTIEILVKGKGGHGAAPHTTIDPVVLSAKIILDLQTIVSRERNPTEPSVVTVGSIHGGTKSNIIPNNVKLQLTVRTTNDVMRKNVKESIERICKAAAMGFRAPEPEFTYFPEEFTPRLLNESKLTRKTTALFREVLGDDKVHEVPMLMGGEDFSRYALGGEIPIFLYFLGTADANRYADSLREGGKSLPSMHSDGYYPTPDKTLRGGVKTMSLAVLNLVGK